LDKLSARVIASQTDAIKVFEKNGFTQVATLKNFVKDVHRGDYQDIAVLVKDLSQD
jgi:RimJ/RimL family protein N-acetyltransferase